MTAYYNEFDAGAASQLRDYIEAGLIAPGHVDERSIEDVTEDDLDGYTQIHLFAGIGGWSYALRLAEIPDDFPVWTGSCPCQPFSTAGKQRGTDDERHLWPHMFRLIDKCRPAIVFGEQVAAKAALGWLDGVFADMEGADYACAAADLCAASIDAPHIRPRIYWVGYTNQQGLQGQHGNGAEPGQAKADGPNTEAGGSIISPPSVDAVHVLRRMDLHNSRLPRPRLRLSTDRRVERDAIRA